MAPVNIAILGAGIFARAEHKPGVLASLDLLNLIAVYSRRHQPAVDFLEENEKGKVDVYSDDETRNRGNNLDKLLSREDLHAVIIALPILVQPDIVKKCILAGKHVLCEKPIAADLARADELIQWYHNLVSPNKPIFAIAENFRFQQPWRVAQSHLSTFGKILTFRVQMTTLVEIGGKYYETEWRKVPSYQGGFLLDGGVHFTAALLLLLGDQKIERLSAFSTQLQPHLPPIDTLAGTFKLENGSIGQVQISFGVGSWKGFEFVIAAEGGSVTVASGGRVIVKDAKGEVVKEEVVKQAIGTEGRSDGNGVGAEVRAFSQSILAGNGVDPRQRPELAYNDLAVIESMIVSAEKGGQPVEVAFKE